MHLQEEYMKNPDMSILSEDTQEALSRKISSQTVSDNNNKDGDKSIRKIFSEELNE